MQCLWVSIIVLFVFSWRFGFSTRYLNYRDNYICWEGVRPCGWPYRKNTQRTWVIISGICIIISILAIIITTFNVDFLDFSFRSIYVGLTAVFFVFYFGFIFGRLNCDVRVADECKKHDLGIRVGISDWYRLY